MAAYGALSSLLLTLDNVLHHGLTLCLNRDQLVYLRERAHELRQYLGNSYSPNARTDDELESLETRVRGVVFRAEDLLASRMYKDHNPFCPLSLTQTGLFAGCYFAVVSVAYTCPPLGLHNLISPCYLAYWIYINWCMIRLPILFVTCILSGCSIVVARRLLDPEDGMDPFVQDLPHVPVFVTSSPSLYITSLLFSYYLIMYFRIKVFDPGHRLGSIAIYLTLPALDMISSPSFYITFLFSCYLIMRFRINVFDPPNWWGFDPPIRSGSIFEYLSLTAFDMICNHFCHFIFISSCCLAMCFTTEPFFPWEGEGAISTWFGLIHLDIISSPSLLPKLIYWLARCLTDDKILSKLLEDFDSIATEVITIGTNAKDAQQPPDPQPPPRDLSSTASSSRRYFVGTGHNTFVGMHYELEEIKSRLLGQARSLLKIVPITGMSGIGKTTFVTQVYNDHDIRHHFDMCAWVTVSQEGYFHKVALDLLNSTNVQLGNKHEGLENVELGVHLHKRLKDRRYLVVMDDVWDDKIWDDVIQFFPNDKNGSCVLLTTQLSEVARYANANGPIHQLRFLNENESRKLLQYRIFGGEDCPHELREIQNEIAQVCGGLPLALTLTGGMLSQVAKTRETWEIFVDNLRSSTTNDDECTKVLEFSYKHLPHHLRSCFLYMGMFPEDYEISVTKLIHLWVAEGFLEHDSTRSMEELAEECLRNLVERNLILVSKWSSHGKIKRCKIHDALRKMCLCVGQEENFLSILSHQNVLKTDMKFSRRLSFHSNILKVCPDILHRMKFGTSTTHSLMCTGAKLSSPQCDYVAYKLLKVLDLLTLRFTGFPLEITRLVCLRYLALTFPGIIHPCISKLQNLQAIVHQDMFSSKNSYLPVEIWMMPNLRHLNVPAICLSSPPRWGGALALQTLVEVINLSFGIQIVRRIKSLRRLTVSYDVDQESFKGWSEHKLENLVCLRELEVLKFGVIDLDRILYPPDLAFPPSLKKLTLCGCRIPWERLKIVATLPNLEVLKLRYNACQGEVWNLDEEEFGQLKSLQLEYMDDLLHWVASEMHFPRLRCLTIKSCPQLKEIPTSIGHIETLERIDVVDCRHGVVTSAKNIRDEQIWSKGESDLKVTVVYLGYEFKYHN